MNRSLLTLALLATPAVFAHGAGHLKGVVANADANQVTLTTEAKTPEVIRFDKDTRFDNDGKPAVVSALAPGLRVIVHLKPGAKLPTAALVKFAAPPPVRVEVSVTADGFVVGKAAPPLKVGTPVTLVVTRTVEKTCATDIVLKEFGLSVPLPLSKPVEVTFVPTQTGKVHFACAMDMLTGDLQVQ